MKAEYFRLSEAEFHVCWGHKKWIEMNMLQWENMFNVLSCQQFTQQPTSVAGNWARTQSASGSGRAAAQRRCSSGSVDVSLCRGPTNWSRRKARSWSVCGRRISFFQGKKWKSAHSFTFLPPPPPRLSEFICSDAGAAVFVLCNACVARTYMFCRHIRGSSALVHIATSSQQDIWRSGVRGRGEWVKSFLAVSRIESVNRKGLRSL